MMAYVKEVTVHGWAEGDVSAGQRESVEGAHSCFSTVQNNWPGVSETFDTTYELLMSDELPNTSGKCQVPRIV